MELLILFGLIIGIGIVIFFKSRGDPDVESFTLPQMIKHTDELQDRIKIQTPPAEVDAIKAEMKKPEADLNYALAVWRRKMDENKLN
jgi:hypothetical protein